jgi:predicted nucleic-acid-binding protein
LPIHLVDTNVLLRFLIGDDPPRAECAAALIGRVEEGKEAVRITDEVLTETVWTLESYYHIPRGEIAARLIALTSIRGVQVPSRAAATHALQLFAAGRADFVDCFLAARGAETGVPVYTFDETDFRKLPAKWESP